MGHRVQVHHVGDQLRLGRRGELALPALDTREGLHGKLFVINDRHVHLYTFVHFLTGSCLLAEVHGHDVRAHVESFRRGVIAARALLDYGRHLGRGRRTGFLLLPVAVVRGVPVPVAVVALYGHLDFFLKFQANVFCALS